MLELLVGIGLGGIVLAIVAATFSVQARSGRVFEEELLRLDDVSWVASRFVDDVAYAGADPQRAGIVPVAALAPDHVILDSDRDGDGGIDERSAERVGWFRRDDGRLLRSVGAQRVAMLIGVGGEMIELAAPETDERRALLGLRLVLGPRPGDAWRIRAAPRVGGEDR